MSNRRRTLTVIPLIAIGGMAGAGTRYLLGAVAGEALLMTATVNAVGSCVLALLLFGLRSEDGISRYVRYVLGTGFLASFTTYSTFIADIALHDPIVGVAYLSGSYATGFAGVVLGRIIVEYWRPGGR